MNKWLKRVLVLIVVLVAMMGLLLLSLQTNFTKNIIKNQVSKYIERKTNTTFKIASLDYKLPQWLELQGVFLKDRAGDTLLYGSKLRVDMNMLKLLDSQVEIEGVELEGIHANIKRAATDSLFNFQFLIDSFVSTQKEDKPKQDTTAFQFSLNRLAITKSSFNWKDAYGGLNAGLSIGNFAMDMDKIDLQKQEYFAKNISMEKVWINVQKGRNNAPPKPSTTKLPLLKATNLAIKDATINYTDVINNYRSSNNISALIINDLVAKLEQNDIAIGLIKLHDSYVGFDKNKPVEIISKEVKDSISSATFKVAVNKIDLLNNQIVYNDDTKPKKQGLDVAHLAIKDFALNANDIFYFGNDMRADVARLQMKDKSGFVLNSLSGQVKMDKDKVVAENLVLRTPYTSIHGEAQFYLASLDNIFKSDQINSISLYNTAISKKDLQLLLPDVAKRFDQQLRGANYLYLTADAKGTSRQLNISRLRLNTDRNEAVIDLRGTVQNPFNTKQLGYNLDIKQAIFNKRFLTPFIPAESAKKINLPPTISLVGKATGTMANLTTNLVAKSSYGSVAVKGNLKNITTPDRLIYDATIVAQNLETGKWIKQDSLLGKLDGTIYVKGQGIDYKKATISSEVNLNAFRYLNHIYKDIKFSLKGTGGNYQFSGGLKDPELNFDANGKANLAGRYPTVDAVLDLRYANLYALGFYEQPLTVQTHADIAIANLNPNLLKAQISMDSTVIVRNRQKFFIDSLVAKGDIVEDSLTLLSLKSPMADAQIKGNFGYTDLDNVIKHLIDTYRGERPESLKENSLIALDMTVKPNPIVPAFVPNLYFDRPITANGLVSTGSSDSTISLNLEIPYLRYDNQVLDDFSLTIRGKQDSLKYSMIADTIRSSNLLFYQTAIDGVYSKNNLTADLLSKDANGRDRYALGIEAILDGDIGKISLKNTLKLNYDNWYVNRENLITVTRNGTFNISDFEIKNNGQVIEAQSTAQQFNAPINVLLKDFDLANITSILNKDSTLIQGLLSANLLIDGLVEKVPTIDGTVYLDSLIYNRIPVGNLNLEATATNKNVKMKGALTGNGNNVAIVGAYTQNNLDIDLNLNPIRLRSIEPFSLGYLRRSDGQLLGNIKIGGTPTNPTWSGKLTFDSVYTQIAQFGTIVRIHDQNLDLSSPNITFQNFIVADSLNQPLTVNGAITRDNRGDLIANLLVNAQDFMALNNTATQSNMYYGRAIVDINAEIKGIISAPEISGNVKVKDNSEITYVRARVVPGLKDREGVMAFVDADTIANMLDLWPSDPTLIGKNAKKADDIYQSSLLKYNLNIDIDRNAEFNIVIDPVTRDQLTVAGPATLNAGVNPNGSLMLTGAYTLTRGTYTLNYQFIRREFDLQDGSSILFKGSPTDAEPNITAIYEVETRPIDLIRNEITNYGLADKIFQQRMPFQVVLKITGTLTEPKLAFDIKLKENVAGINTAIANAVNNKLTQLRYDASQLNKQVFALLVMNRFFGEQARDFFAGGGSSPQDVIKESVSRFLSDAVNQIAADLIKGVDLNVDLRSVDDYASAAKRTDLDLALSKRFLNDRVSVTVGKNFTLEGEDPVAKSQNNSSVQFLPDISTSYKLSKDGKYMLRAYRRNQYEAILDGYFIETGLVFSFSLDYNHARELLFWQNVKK